jgi:hypothetical protein
MVTMKASRDRSVGIAVDYELANRVIGVRLPAGEREVSFLENVQTDLQKPTRARVLWVPGDRSSGEIWPECEAEHSYEPVL